MRRDFAVSTMGFGSCVSRGKVSLSANASSLVGGARQQLSDLRQSFSYNWTQWACNDQLQSDKPHEGKKGVAIHVDRSPHDLSLSIPLPLSDGLSSRLSGMVHVLNAWTSVAAKTLAGAAAGAPIMGASLIQLRCMLSSATAAGGVAMSALPLKLSGFGATSFFDSGLVEQAVQEELATHVGLFSLTSAVMFIGSLRGLNKHSTAQRGNLMGMVATALPSSLCSPHQASVAPISVSSRPSYLQASWDTAWQPMSKWRTCLSSWQGFTLLSAWQLYSLVSQATLRQLHSPWRRPSRCSWESQSEHSRLQEVSLQLLSSMASFLAGRSYSTTVGY
jgi:hypothetical protein